MLPRYYKREWARRRWRSVLSGSRALGVARHENSRARKARRNTEGEWLWELLSCRSAAHAGHLTPDCCEGKACAWVEDPSDYPQCPSSLGN